MSNTNESTIRNPPITPPPLHVAIGECPLTETLLSATTSATLRNEEATSMFSGVAIAIDDALKSVTTKSLPNHLKITYRGFLLRLQSVAKEFIEGHVRGISKPPLNPVTRASSHPTPTASRMLCNLTHSETKESSSQTVLLFISQ